MTNYIGQILLVANVETQLGIVGGKIMHWFEPSGSLE